MSWHVDPNGVHHKGRLGSNSLEFKPGPASRSRKKRRAINHADAARVHHDERNYCDVATRVRKADVVKVARRRAEKASRKAQRRRAARYGG